MGYQLVKRSISKYLFACLLAGTAVLSGNAVAQDEGFPPANVRVSKVTIQSLAPITIVPGTVASRSDSRLAAEVEGRLVQVADVGLVVNEGDVLAKVEDTSLVLRSRELDAEITRAQARLKFLDGELVRFTRLAESNLAAATQLDQTRADRDVAQGDLLVARSRLAQNQDLLRRTSIRAPFGGIVVERLMNLGERVSEGSDVIRLVDQSHLEVIARAPLEYFPFVRQGLELDLRAGEIQTRGIVRAVVAVGDENTHQFEIRVDLQERSFPIGRTLRVSIPVSDVRDVVAVPRDALVLRPEGITVFVIDSNGLAQQVKVTTGIGSGDSIEIRGAVSEGDDVVIRGNERLQPGQQVNINES
jgi:RND family efflux transporter MFP subunit